MRKLIFKLGIVLLWVTMLSYLLFDDVHSYTRIMIHEMYQQEDNIDILLLGASHVYRGINPDQMGNLTGYNVFNASSSSQQLQGSYYLLKQAVENNNDIQMVLLDVNYGINNLDADGDIQTYLITNYMKCGIDKYSYLYHALGVNGIVCDCFHVLQGCSNPFDIVPKKFSSAYKNYEYDWVNYSNEQYRGKGFVYSMDTIDSYFSDWDPNKIDPDNIVPEYTAAWLDEIYDYCKSNDIELVLIECPVTDANVYVEYDKYDKYIKWMQEYTERNSIKYWNYNLMGNGLLGMRTDYYKDAVHLNGAGATRFTEVLSNTLKDNTESFFYSSLDDKFSERDFDETVYRVLK